MEPQEKVPSAPSTTESPPLRPNQADAALTFAAHPSAVRIDAAADRRVRRRIDRHLLPWMCGLYLLQYLDKTTLSYASSMGIVADAGLSAAQYSWTGSVFYIGGCAGCPGGKRECVG